VEKTYKDISRFPDVSSAIRKFSGGKNDKGVWRGRGTVDGRREGRTYNLELVDGERGFLGCCGPDRTLYFGVSLETNDSELWNAWDVDGSLGKSHSTGPAEEKQDSGSGPDRTGRPICSPGFPEDTVTRSLPNDRYEHGSSPEGLIVSSSENGNVRAA
jgi:hypothetical protein